MEIARPVVCFPARYFSKISGADPALLVSGKGTDITWGQQPRGTAEEAATRGEEQPIKGWQRTSVEFQGQGPHEETVDQGTSRLRRLKMEEDQRGKRVSMTFSIFFTWALGTRRGGWATLS